MSGITLLYPYALLLIPLYLVCKRFCRRSNDGILFTRTDILQTLFRQKNRLISVVEFLTILALSLSLSYPTIIQTNHFESREQSTCMLLSSYPPNKPAVEFFLDARPCDRIGTVFYGNSVFTASAPTTNITLLKKALFSYQDNVLDKQSLENAFAKTRALLDRNDTIYTDIHLSAIQKAGLQKLFSIQIRHITDIAPNTLTTVKTVTYKEPLFRYPLFATLILLALYLYLTNRIKK